MIPRSSIIEIHYAKDGVQPFYVGGSARPDWLPNYTDHKLVGLFGKDDIELENNEYVIELSRHEKDNILITWIGVWGKTEDLTYGDRNYNIGLGVWLADLFPREPYQIVNYLMQICKLLQLEKEPTDKVKTACEKFLNDESLLPRWLINVNNLPNPNLGLVFNKDRHPPTVLLKPRENDNNSLIVISKSILENCVYAQDDIKNKSRILYLILNPNRNKKISNPIIELTNERNPSTTLLDYSSKLSEGIQNKKQEFNNKFEKLLADTKKNEIIIKEKDEKIISLESKNQYLSEEANKLPKKSEGEMIDDLRSKVIELIDSLEKKSEDVRLKTDEYMNIQHSSYNNSYNEVLTRIKEISNQIKDQKNNTPNSPVKIYSPPPTTRTKPDNVDKYRTSEGSSSNSFLPSFPKIMLLVVVFLLGIIIYFLFPGKEEPKIEAVIPIQKNISTNDLENIFSKLEVISSKVDSIEDKLQPSNTLEEIKQTVPTRPPSNGKKIGYSKIIKNSKNGKQ